MIAINEDIEVPSPPSAVWKVISDPSAVVTCIDGASLGEEFDDGSFAGKLQVKFGPMRVGFTARISLVLDEPNLSGTMTASGKDGHGGTRAKTTATFTVEEREGGSTVKMRGDVDLSGKLASVIEAGANVVVKRMVGDFTEAFAKKCAETPA